MTVRELADAAHVTPGQISHNRKVIGIGITL